jgi:predicted flap endonuclease-1-like 5' DNA nuclease
MKDKNISSFWIGFVFSILAIAAAYWYYRQNPDAFAALDLGRGADKQGAPDSLEAIYGIGPIYAQRLRESGITSFADLAGATAGQIDAILGRHVPQATDWIAEANKLRR